MSKKILLPCLVGLLILTFQSTLYGACTASNLTATIRSAWSNYWLVTLSFTVTDCGCIVDTWWKFDMQPQKEGIIPPDVHNPCDGPTSATLLKLV